MIPPPTAKPCQRIVSWQTFQSPPKFFKNYLIPCVFSMPFGNFLLFPLTAVAGSVFILFLAKATPSQNVVAWLGQNALILFCLNGIFYHFINGRAAQWVMDNLSGSALTIFGAGCLVTLASLALCIPFIFLFNKFVPQLVGRPKVSGPWLKNFIWIGGLNSSWTQWYVRLRHQ